MVRFEPSHSCDGAVRALLMAIQMGSQHAEQVAVKTDEFGRPVYFLRAYEDSSDELVMIDGWARYWNVHNGAEHANIKDWVVVAQGRAYDLQQLRRHDEGFGGDNVIWTATPYQE